MAARFRAVFFGTPEIAVPALRALCEVAEVPGVVCQPDRPSGRGMRLRAPAVKVAARELGLPVHQPERVRSGELMLAHYPGEDRTTTVRFHFSGDSLYRVELGVAPAEGQSRGELYDTLQAFYAAQYAHARERSATRWSDGTVIAQIGMAENAVEVTFTCPAARR